MKNKIGLLLLLLMYLAVEFLTMIAMATLLSKGQVFFTIITMYGVHYHASKVTETFEKLIRK